MHPPVVSVLFISAMLMLFSCSNSPGDLKQTKSGSSKNSGTSDAQGSDDVQKKQSSSNASQSKEETPGSSPQSNETNSDDIMHSERPLDFNGIFLSCAFINDNEDGVNLPTQNAGCRLMQENTKRSVEHKESIAIDVISINNQTQALSTDYVTLKDDSNNWSFVFGIPYPILDQMEIRILLQLSDASQVADSLQICPQGYIAVPGNPEAGLGDNFSRNAADIKKSGSFCVMQYEAHNSDQRMIPTETSKPFYGLRKDQAHEKCLGLNTDGIQGYDLINNQQWQVIARNIEKESSKNAEPFTDFPGLYRYYGGLNDLGPLLDRADPEQKVCFDTWSELQARCDNGNGSYVSNSNCNDLSASYTSCVRSSFPMDKRVQGINIASGSLCGQDAEANRYECKRELVLSNGKSIFDFSGHLGEWIRDELPISNEIREAMFEVLLKGQQAYDIAKGISPRAVVNPGINSGLISAIINDPIPSSLDGVNLPLQYFHFLSSYSAANNNWKYANGLGSILMGALRSSSTREQIYHPTVAEGYPEGDAIQLVRGGHIPSSTLWNGQLRSRSGLYNTSFSYIKSRTTQLQGNGDIDENFYNSAGFRCVYLPQMKEQ